MNPKTSHYILLWGCCFCISTLVLTINSSWTVDPYGWVDQWGYLGQALDFPSSAIAFPNSPTRDLVPVIVPLAIAHKFLSPLLANQVHDVIQLTVIVAACGTILLRRHGSSISAIVIALLFANPYVLAAGGSSYTDGKVAAYLALTLMTLELSDFRWPKTSTLFLTGLMTGFVVFSAILNAALLPILILGYVLLKQSQLATLGSASSSLTLILPIFWGFFASTIIFQAIYFLYGDGFFFWRNIRKLFDFTIGGSTRAPEFSQWLPTASWLIIPLAITFVAAVFLMVKWKNLELSDRFLLLLSPVLFSMLLFINVVIKQWPLQHLYFAQSLPVHYLTLGTLLKHSLDSRGAKRMWTQCALVAVVILTLWSNVSIMFFSSLLSPIKFKYSNLTMMQGLVGCVLILTAVLLWQIRSSKISPLTLSLFLAISLFSASPSYVCQLCENGYAKSNRPSFAASVETNLKNTLMIRSFLRRLDSSSKGKIWFDEASAVGPLLRQVNAVTYLNEEGSRISKAYPQIIDEAQPVGSSGSFPDPGDLLLIVGLDLNTSLPNAVANLAAAGLAVAERSDYSIQLINTELHLDVIVLKLDN